MIIDYHYHITPYNQIIPIDFPHVGGLSQEKRRSVQQRIDEVQRLKRAATATAPSAAAPSEEQPALEIPEGGGWVPSGVNAD